ncbi:hypothetical protein JHW43_007163 [Diplocarpon mali]|nr:hypothetical protein JHW43_007163 [Diplocarpon mali]
MRHLLVPCSESGGNMNPQQSVKSSNWSIPNSSGSRPKKATNVKKEMTNITMAALRTFPIAAGKQETRPPEKPRYRRLRTRKNIHRLAQFWPGPCDTIFFNQEVIGHLPCFRGLDERRTVGMALARTVYEGDVGRGEGDLFLGMKFHLAMRLPTRARWKDLIEQNGGTVTKLDSKPEVIKIADHARKDCPEGSISWKWIDASVQKGSLQNFEDYLAGPAGLRDRPVGSEQPIRDGRVPFSHNDDKILMKYCTRAEQSGASMAGNQIYREFALKHLQHTAQSWRDRWVKRLQFCKRPELQQANESEESEESETNHKSTAPAPPLVRKSYIGRPQNKSPILRTAPAKTQAYAKSHTTKSTSTHISTASPSDGGNVFTDEETDLLFEQYETIMEINDDQIIDAWIAWSVANPNHTPQEWRNYFKEYVIPTRNEETKRKKRREKQAKEMVSPGFSDVEVLQSKSSSSEPAPKKFSDIEVSQGSTGQKIELPATLSENVDPCLINRDEFELNVRLVADHLGLEVEFEPVICDRKISLFELWQVVQSPQFGGFDEVTVQELWGKVASELRFEQNTSAASDLQTCYSEILADFETIREEFLDKAESSELQHDEMIEDQPRYAARQTEGMNGVGANMDDEDETGEVSEAAKEQDEELDNDLLPNEGQNRRGHRHIVYKLSREAIEELHNQHEHYDDDLESPQISPRCSDIPSPSAGKRKLGTDLKTRDDLLLIKRQRINKGKEREIPSTPEDIIKTSHTFTKSHQPSPLKFTEPSSRSESSSVEERMPTTFEGQKLVTAKQALVFEPETQDFHFPQSLQNLDTPQESIDNDAGEDESLFVLSPRRGSRPPPSRDTDEDEDEDEDIILVRQSSPITAGASPERENSRTFISQGSLRSSSNNYESSTQSQTESEKNEQLLAFINKNVLDGYAYDIVMEALTATTMSVREALKVMESLADGDGIPEDVPGVWTKWDDDALQGSKHTENYQVILRKHGLPRIMVRRRYLRDTKAVNGGSVD